LLIAVRLIRDSSGDAGKSEADVIEKISHHITAAGAPSISAPSGLTLDRTASVAQSVPIEPANITRCPRPA